MSIQQLPQLPPYIRLCEVIIQYTDKEVATLETYLDLNLSVEDQVFESFNPLSNDFPQILSFKWRDLGNTSLPKPASKFNTAIRNIWEPDLRADLHTIATAIENGELK